MSINDDDAYAAAIHLTKSSPLDESAIFDKLSIAADEGDCRALYALSTWYIHGFKNGKKDVRKGLKLLKRSAQSNIAEASFDLAYAYDSGLIESESGCEAFEYYMRAALLGDRASCEQISEYFRSGEIVPCSSLLSELWLQRSNHSEEDISSPARVWLDPEFRAVQKNEFE